MSGYRSAGRKRVVIAGGGFAGLWAARALASGEAARTVDVLVLDRNNYHTFLPLLYQVAAAELEPEQIAYPLRGVFRRMDNVDFRLTCVTGADFSDKVVHTDGGDVPYDYLVLAMGSNTEFYGVPGAEEHAFRLKSLEQAIALRNHILTRFEIAAHEPDPDVQRRMLTFTVVGGGPTGVEYAGALAELIRTPIAKDFSDFNTGQARVVLLEAADGLLAGFPETLRQYTFRRLTRMGVDVRLHSGVAAVETHQVRFREGAPLATDTVVWSAGIRGNRTAERMALPFGRGMRVTVLPSLQLAEHADVYAVGDLAQPMSGDSRTGEVLSSPMIAPNATQQGRLAAANILRQINGEEVQPFRYRDKGAMATIGRSSAVVRIGDRAVSGLVAWVLWLFVHLAYLIGFRNRMFVMVNWAWDYLFFERSVRLILPRIPWIEGRHDMPAACVGDDEGRLSNDA